MTSATATDTGGQAKRIILFYKNLTTPGGAERLLAEEWANFTDAGCEVKIVCFAFSETCLFEYRDRALRDVHVCRGSSWIARMAAAYRFFRAFAPDAIVVASGLLEAPWIAHRRTKVIFHYHQPPSMSFTDYLKYSWLYAKDFDWICARNRTSGVFRTLRSQLSWTQRLWFDLKARVHRAAVNRCAAILVFSDYAKEDAERFFSAPVVVLKGALSGDAVEQMKELPARQPSTRPTVLSVARLDPNKRIDVVIRAMARLRQDVPALRCLIVGDGPQRAELEQLIEDLSLETVCELLGFIPDEELSRLYRSCDVFVSVDWADFRLTAFEALAAGAPVIVSDEADVDPKLRTAGYLSSAAPEPLPVAAEVLRVLGNADARDLCALRSALVGYTWPSYCRAILALV